MHLGYNRSSNSLHPLQVWLAEQCHLLEKRNLDLRKDLREAVEKSAKASADADKYRALADDLKMQILHTAVMAAGSSKLENRLQEQVTQLKARVRELEAQKKEITKDRNTESRILDKVCEKHSMLEQEIKKEAARHEIEESKYTSMLEDFRAVTERETHQIVADLQLRNQQVVNLQKTLKTLEAELVKLRQQLLDTSEQLADGREREQSLTLEKELLNQQLEDMTAAYRRDLGEARAQASGVALTQARLLETQGMLRGVEQELSELKATVSDTLSREAALVGRIMVARNETAEAISAKVSAERMYQHQHIASVACQIAFFTQLTHG
jgi:chromosome segregation ATPase